MSLIISKFGMITNNKKIWLPESCVHEYVLENNANDSTGNNDGTPYNMSYVNGKVGKAGSFNGSSSYIDLGTPPTFSRAVKTAGGGCAYECWIYVNSWGTTVSRNVFIGDSNGWDIEIGSNDTGQIYARKFAAASYDAVETGLSLSTWYHIVFNIYSNYTTQLFINGISRDTTYNTDVPSDATRRISIGCYPSISRYWDGSIDQIRLYNHSLITDEVTALYNNGNGR